MAAKQRGDRQLKGSVGQTTYVRTKHGYLARERVENNADKIFSSDPRFQRMRENMAEFKQAGIAGKLLRDAIRNAISVSSDGSATQRLMRLMLQVVKSDPVNDRGRRIVSEGNIKMLEGFEFNETAPMSLIFPPNLTTSIDRVTGICRVDIATFVPAKKLSIPQGADHFRIIAAAAEIDFDAGTYISIGKVPDPIPWNQVETNDIEIQMNLTPNSQKPMFLVLGLEFSQVVNGKHYPILSKDFYGLKLVKVDTPS